MEWPENSLDLNSIKNCWRKMRKVMAEKTKSGHPEIGTLQSLVPGDASEVL